MNDTKSTIPVSTHQDNNHCIFYAYSVHPCFLCTLQYISACVQWTAIITVTCNNDAVIGCDDVTGSNRHSQQQYIRELEDCM